MTLLKLEPAAAWAGVEHVSLMLHPSFIFESVTGSP